MRQSRTSAKKTCVRTEECASASGTPTAATVPLVTEARTASKVREKEELEVGGVVVVWLTGGDYGGGFPQTALGVKIIAATGSHRDGKGVSATKGV